MEGARQKTLPSVRKLRRRHWRLTGRRQRKSAVRTESLPMPKKSVELTRRDQADDVKYYYRYFLCMRSNLNYY